MEAHWKSVISSLPNTEQRNVEPTNLLTLHGANVILW